MYRCLSCFLACLVAAPPVYAYDEGIPETKLKELKAATVVDQHHRRTVLREVRKVRPEDQGIAEGIAKR
jgi:hypothetical protein